MKKVLVILGPTATGKTDIALQLASKFQGELVSADSRQVYKGLDIGTGKEPGIKNKELRPDLIGLRIKRENGYWEIEGIKVWMYDVADTQVRYTVADYVDQANKVIKDILKRGKLPIIVGGTGFYIKALIEGLPNLKIPVDPKLRGELEKLSVKELKQKLQVLSPITFEKLNNSDKNNPRRLLRSIELVYMNGHVNTSDKRKVVSNKWEIFKVGLTAPRQVLQKRIFNRLISRIDQGLIKEAEKLHQNGLTLKRMTELGLEYGMLAKFLSGEISVDQLTNQLSFKISQYAKRQMTWFKRDKDIQWFDITASNLSLEVEKMVNKWYYQGNDSKN